MTAIRNQDKIGLILFSDRILKSIPPRKGRTAVMRLVREVLAADETRERTDITAALRFLNNVQKRKAVVFLVSDFQDADYERELRVTARHHDVIAFKCFLLFHSFRKQTDRSTEDQRIANKPFIK